MRWPSTIALLLLALAFSLVLSPACGDDDDDGNDEAPRDFGDDDDTGPGPDGDDDSAGGDDDDGADDDGAEDDDDENDDDGGADDDDQLIYPSDPADTGPLPVAQSAEKYVDPASDDEEPLLVFFPSDDGGASVDDRAAPYPFVIFGPRPDIDSKYYTSYLRNLASWGFIVALRGNEHKSHERLSNDEVGIINWASARHGDGQSVFYNIFDLSRVATVGHGLGGKIAFLTAYHDERVRAIVGLDPDDSLPAFPLPIEDYPSVAPELMQWIDRPSMIIGASLGGDCVDPDENWDDFYSAAKKPSYEIVMVNAGHLDFLDNPNCPGCNICNDGQTDSEVVRKLARRYLTAFLAVQLRFMDSYNTWFAGDGIAEDVASGKVTTRKKE
ncbi:hypothetical protein K8I61_15840 [bacterium]|nr:hypothetical protein [bacterium]